MASVVDTSVKYYTSDMANAPVLNGVAGAMSSLLAACLKDGFDVKVLASLVVAGGVATCTWVGAHSAIPNAVIAVSGVSGGPTGYADLNGEQRVQTKPNGTSCTFFTNVADGTATGTISIKIAGAGWVTPFTGTNVICLQSNDPTSSKHILRVDDTGTTFVRVVGYESMSDVNTGLGPFPTTAQMSGGGYWPKSITANANAIKWSIQADPKIFYFNNQPGNASGAQYQIGNNRMFGEPITLKPGGDPFCTVLNYSTTATVANQNDQGLGTTAGTGAYATPRGYLGLGSAVLDTLYASFNSASTIVYSGVSNNFGAFPSPVDGSLIFGPKYLGYTPRANLPGLMHCGQTTMWNNFKHGDIVPGSGAYAGRNFVAATSLGSATAFSTASDTNNTGILLFDVTGPWR